MGEQDVKSNLEGEQLRLFMQRLLADLRALEQMLDDGWIESGITRIGAEQELFIIDQDMQPAMKAMELLEEIDDDHFTTELGRFNVEFNLDPLPFGGDCLSRLERDLTHYLLHARNAAEELDLDVVMVGILPTLQIGDLGHDSITPKERYYALNEAMKKLRGDAFEFRFMGTDELIVKHDNVMLEACNTSFQIHFQVSKEDFVRLYNIAQFLSAPVLSAAVNSPLLFGQRLWQETRIGLFQQAVDTRKSGHHIQERLARVSFGQDWVHDSVLEILKEDITRFRVILGTDLEDDPNPFDELAAGRPPQLKALRLHNGTVYRWNRPCYGIGGGKAHLRIENRYIPAGPTPVDEVANAAFWFGLMKFYSNKYEDITKVFEFDDAKSNFLTAAREGLDARFKWLGGARVSSQELILLQLLPQAADGLAMAGLDRADVDHYLGVIESRVSAGRTGASWMLDGMSRLKPGKKGDRTAHLVRMMTEQQRENRPIHKWPDPDVGKAEGFNVYRRVSSLMTTDVFSVNQNEVIDLVACMMDWKHIRHVPVEDDENNLVGIVSYRSLIRMLSKGSGRNAAAAREVMQEPITIEPETLIIDAIRIMREKRVSCLPVAKNRKLVGIITDHDFLDLAAELLEEKHATQGSALSRWAQADEASADDESEAPEAGAEAD